MLAFTGFESAAPLAEEARDPKRTIRQAVILSCLFIGIFYVFTTYAAMSRPSRATWPLFPLDATVTLDFPCQAGVGSGVGGRPHCHLQFFLANANAGSNATTRTWFAMGRIRLLPEIMSSVHPRWKSPHFAVVTQFVVAVGLALWLGFQYGAYTAWLFMATLFTLILIVIYILVLLSCITSTGGSSGRTPTYCCMGSSQCSDRSLRARVPRRWRSARFQLHLQAQLPVLPGGAGGWYLGTDRCRLSRVPAAEAS